MSFVVNFSTHLEISGIPLSCAAWEHTNLYLVLNMGSGRGENVIMPGAVGRRAVRRRIDEATVTLELAIFGDRDPIGAPTADPIAGLIDNIEYLQDHLVDPPAAANSLRPAVIHHPAGTLTANVQILGFEIGDAYSPGCVTASLDMTVIGGRFR